MTLIGSSHARPCPICGTSGCACGGTTTTPGINPLRFEETHVSNKGEPVHEYDVHANGYDTVMNLTEKDAERYPGAKKRTGPLAPDHPGRADDDGAAETEKASTSSKARPAPKNA